MIKAFYWDEGGAAVSFTPVKTPEKQYRGVNLWFLNDRLEDEELIRQLDNMDKAGCGSIIARTFDGLNTEYLSEEFHARMRTIVDHAGKLGMKVYLQAGYMPGGIPELKPEHRACVVAALHDNEEMEPDDQVLYKDNQFTYVRRFRNNYINLLDHEAVSSYLQQAYDEAWQQLHEDFGKTVFSVWVDEPEFSPDQMPWSEPMLIRFEEIWGYRLEEHIPALFQRSDTSYKVRYHYRRTLLLMFIEAYFEQVSHWCDERGLQFSGHLMGEDRLDSQIGFTVSAMPLYSYMHLPGIDHLTGNLRWTALDRSGEMSIPFIMTPKQCSSVAHQEGKQTVLSEMYGVSSQGLTFQDQKRIAEYLAVLGINHRCLHGSFYSMRGRRKRIYVPHLSEQQPWWDEYAYAADYFARLSYALHQGQFAADVLVLHPIESAYGLYEPHDFGERKTEDVFAMNAHLTELSGNLLSAQIGYDYGDEHVMEQKAYVDADGQLHIGQMSYRIIILPMLFTLRESTLRLLEQFVDGGGILASTSSFPELVDCEPSEALRRLKDKAILIDHSIEALKAMADKWLDRKIRITAEQGLESIWIQERSLEDQQMVYMINTNEKCKVNVVLHAKEYQSAEQYHLDNGELSRLRNEQIGCEGVKVSFALEPWESRVLLFNPASEAFASLTTSTVTEQLITDTIVIPAGQMTMKRVNPNALTLDFCRYRKGSQLYSSAIPVIAVQEILTEEDYEGPVSLCFEFQAESIPSYIAAVIEHAKDYTIRVNDRDVCYEGLPYYTDPSFLPVDISSYIVQGSNQIEISREFKPLKKTNFFHANRFQNIPGVELESIYLIGDFAVYGAVSDKPQRDRCIRLKPDMYIGEETVNDGASWPEAGYPFYSGAMMYRTKVLSDRLEASERIEIALSGLEACMAVIRINGQEAAKLAWKPFNADITAMVTAGENEIEIIVINTLRNLLGPHHHPKGEMDYSYGEESFSGRRLPEKGMLYPGWYNMRTEDTLAWTDDYFFIAYGLTGIQIIRYSAEQAK